MPLTAVDTFSRQANALDTAPSKVAGVNTKSVAFALPVTWKNLGYYVAGAVWEEYESVGGPSVSPPSGHTLIGLSTWTEG